MNNPIHKWSSFIVRNRWAVIIFCLIITVIFLFGFKHLYFYNKFTSWLSPRDADLSLFLKTSEKFSINELVMLVIKPNNGLFNAATLSTIQNFTETLQNRREIFHVSSIASAADIIKIEDGIEVRNLLEDIPTTPEEIKKFKIYMLSHKSFVGNVVSADGTWTAISIFINSTYDSEKVVKQVIFPESRKFFSGKAEVYFSGIPSDAQFITDAALKDLMVLTPIIFILIAIILYISFRSAKGIIFPSLVVVIATIWLFGLIGFLHKPLTFLTSIIPVLLTALGSAYGIHILNKYNHDLENHEQMDKAQLIRSTAHIFIPVILAGVTTFIGFLSFQTAKLKIIADFGLFSAIGIAFSLFIALSLIPALSSFVRFRKKRNSSPDYMTKFLSFLAEKVISNKILVSAVAIFVLGIFSIGIPRIKKEMNFTEYFPRNSVPRISNQVVTDHFDGAYPVLFYFNTQNSKSPEILRLMRKSENYLLSLNEISIPVSVSSLIHELNFQMNDLYALPENINEINNLWFFMEGRKETEQIITDNNQEALIFAKSRQTTTDFNKYLYRNLKQFIKNHYITRRPFNFDLENLSEEEKKPILQEEIKSLLEEIQWVAKHYLRRTISESFITNILTGKILNGLQKESGETPGIEKGLGTISGYIRSEHFDFRITETTQSQIIREIERLIRSGTLQRQGIMTLLRQYISRTEYNAEIAEDVTDSILYEYREARKKWLAENTWNALNFHFQSQNEEFEKRIKSIIFDLQDEMALLPLKSIGKIKGLEIQFNTIAQTGSPSMLARLDYYLTSSQIQSLVIAYLLTLIIMVIMRRNLILGIISTVPIAFTISVIYGFLGHSGIPLDYATMMVGSVSIGVGIDYAIHFIHGVSQFIDRGLSLEDATRQAFIERGKAIVYNALAVIAGFAILLFSSMLIMRNFGGTMMGSMFVASFTTLAVLPAGILVLKPKLKKETKNEEKVERYGYFSALVNRHKPVGLGCDHHIKKG